MPSVRDIVQGALHAAEQGTAVGNTLATGEEQNPKVEAPGLPKPEVDSHTEMADRIRQAALRRTELARLEVERRQNEVIQHEERLSEAQKHDLPPNEIAADLNEAQMRLSEARSDYVRAKEAQFNTEMAIKDKPAQQQEKVGANQHHPSVREQLKGLLNRGTGNGNAAKVSAPKPKL